MKPEPEAAGLDQAARASLLGDAGYCAGLGTGLVLAAGPAGRTTGLPSRLVRAAGAATAGWGLLVAGLTVAADGSEARTRLTAGVAAANAGAAGALALFGRTRARRSGRLLLYILAGQVAAFAVVQAGIVAPRRGRDLPSRVCCWMPSRGRASRVEPVQYGHEPVSLPVGPPAAGGPHRGAPCPRPGGHGLRPSGR